MMKILVAAGIEPQTFWLPGQCVTIQPQQKFLIITNDDNKTYVC